MLQKWNYKILSLQVGHIANPKLGELEHSPEIIAESIKYSKRDADKEKFIITLELELQEK